MKELLAPLAGVDRKALVALVYCALALTILEYGFHPPRVEGYLRGEAFGSLRAPSLRAGQIWSAGTIAFFGLVPALIVRLYHREPLSSIGVRAAGFGLDAGTIAGSRRSMPVSCSRP